MTERRISLKIEDNPYLSTALQATRDAGALLMECFGKLQPGQIRHKGPRDLVTDADYRSEKLIVDRLVSDFPDHAILAEENTKKTGKEPYQWFIDPLDGTNNFAHNHPYFAISVAMAHKGTMEIGVVYAPLLQELFYAARGQGAYREDPRGGRRKIEVSTVAEISQGLLGCGFAYKRMEDPPVLDRIVTDFLASCQDIRRCGAAALDLCYVACGCYDGFWEWGLYPHDVAAGSLIIEEAKGKVTDWKGGDSYLWGYNIVASNGRLHRAMLEQLRLFSRHD